MHPYIGLDPTVISQSLPAPAKDHGDTPSGLVWGLGHASESS
jgi:hypothetical protein